MQYEIRTFELAHRMATRLAITDDRRKQAAETDLKQTIKKPKQFLKLLE